MALEQQNDTTSTQSMAPERKPIRWRRRIGLVAALGIFFLIVLTASGLANGWWNPIFGGDQSVYQPLSQTATDHGITIQLTQAYADEGRTVLVYTIRPLGFTNQTNLSSTTPQKQEALSYTSCDVQDGSYHCYWVQPSFLVPTGTHTLTLTWDIGQVIPQASVSPSVSRLASIKGDWHFVFTIPFHHEWNSNLPDPIHSGQQLPG